MPFGLPGLGLKTYIFGAMAIMAAIIGGIIYYQHTKIQNLTTSLVVEQENRKTLEQAVDTQEKTIGNLVDNSKQQIDAINKLQSHMSDVRQQANETKDILTGYINRLDAAANKRPGLVSRKATAAFSETLQELGQ